MGEASDGVDVAPVALAAVGGGTGQSGDGGGKEMELGASNGLVAWAAVGGGDGGSSEVGCEEMVHGAGAGEE